MPGYTMHLTEAAILLPKIREKWQPDPVWINRFLIGSLLPDTKIREDKKESHFWNPADMIKLARAPEMDRFYARYEDRLWEPQLLGYWAHLYLDHCYVKEFWPRTFAFLDAKGQETEEYNRICYVEIQKTGARVLLPEFYSEKYYYGDYNRMNRVFFDQYPIEVPEYEEGFDPEIEEIQIKNMHRVLSEIEIMTKEMQTTEPEPTKVFDVGELDAFLQENAEDFWNMVCRKF